MWLKDHSCEGVVKDSWGDDSMVGSAWSFMKKIYACQDNLREWNRKSFGHVRNLLQKKLADLKTHKGIGRTPYSFKLLGRKSKS